MTFVLAALLALATPEPTTVVIDAVVSDARGRAVDTLKLQDFELREDGAVSALDDVHFVRDEPRIVAIYLDEYHVSSGAATDRVRAALTEFIDRDLGPNDLVVVMKPLDSLLKIDLTRDRASAREMVAAFEGRKGDYAARNDYERQFIAGTPPRIEAARTQVAWSAMQALAVHLGTVGTRRKTLIVVTEGLALADRRRGQETMPSFDSVVRAANRSNVAVYTVYPGSDSPVRPVSQTRQSDSPVRLTGQPGQPDVDLVGRLAEETDGQSIAGDLNAGLRRATVDAGGYYILTYRATHPSDGKFHGVQVRVKRTGTHVHARSGYFARSPDDVLRAAVLERLNAPKPDVPLEPAPHASTLIQPWFGWARGDDGKTRVTFVWEPAARVPGDRGKRLASQLVFTALATDGAVLYEGPVSPTGVGTIEEPGAVPSRAVFDAPPGRVKLRMTIQDVAAQVLDRDVRDIVVRDLKGDVALGTPQVLRARNAREMRTLDNQSAVPVVSREFSRAEQLLVRVPVYASPTRSPVVSARLLSRMGQAMRTLPVAPAASREGVENISLPLAGLAAGEYVIEVIATTPAGEAKDRVTFRVTS
jgi:VWFA-related protein